jgi:hypothetical protein
MLFSLFILGCGGTPEMVPEGPDNTTELTPEQVESEIELQNASRGQ